MFKDGVPAFKIPSDYPRKAVNTYKGDRKSFVLIDKDKMDKLEEVARDAGTTLNTVLLAAYNIFLSKYTSYKEICVGVPTSGRLHPDLENTIGMFVNTLIIKSSINENETFKEFLQHVKKNITMAYENQNLTFEKIVDLLNIKKELNSNPIFNTMFSMEEYTFDEVKLNDIDIVPYDCKNKVSKFDFSIEVIKKKEELAVIAEYSTELFKSETIDRLIGYFRNVVCTIIENYNVGIKEICIISKEEETRLLNEINNTEVYYDKNLKIHDLFEQQVLSTPDKIALVLENESLTYKELNIKANKVASKLMKSGIKTGDIVSLIVKRNFNMLIGILGILKAGATYIPIDIEYPSQRIEYIIKNSKTNIILTEKALMEEMSYNCRYIVIDDDEIDKLSGENKNINYDNKIAYIIYTSGSTGNPKGVMIKHNSIINYIIGVKKNIDINEERIILLLTTISFDIFVNESLLPLLSGAKVVIADEDVQKDPQKIIDVIVKNRVDIIQATPSRIQLMLEVSKNLSCFEGLKSILVGGEAFPSNLLNRLNKLPNTSIFNLYGPTETTVFSTIKNLTGETEVTIGMPISNTQVYILDENNKLCPIGVEGEICISGDGVAYGYSNNPKLTSEKFIKNPFNPDLVLYKTGDIGKYISNNDIKCLGRMDYQVKVRGYRVEIEEIEKVLDGNEKILESVVVNRKYDDGSDYLCAYVISEEKIDRLEIRNYLSEYLPEYMVPSQIIQLEKFPTTPNGKIDRKSLPVVEIKNDIKENQHVNNKIEEILLGIWSKVVNIDHISVNDNFYNIGANSIQIVKIQCEIDKIFPNKIKVVDLYRLNTIRKVAEYINEGDLNANNVLEKRENSIEDIAIIGIGAKMPMSETIDEFWKNISEGKSCIRDIPKQRKEDADKYLKYISVYNNNDELSKYLKGAYIDQIDKFDNEFFGMSPKEASLIDPGQRLFLEVAYEAIEDSGYSKEQLRKKDIGVYVGYNSMNSTEYMNLVEKVEPEFFVESVMNNMPMMTASRVSYILDFRGPAMVVDTACSSSLIAIDLACQAIKNNTCNMAIAGGIKLDLLNIKRKYKLDVESKNDITKTFDDSSNGTAVGEGMAALLLKPLGDAIRDNDNIYAVIKGCATNQDGSSVGITAPNPEAQEKVIIKAWEKAGINPEEVSYIEAHGTGTKIGDPIEVDSIDKAFKRYTDKKQFCAISSVKSNIGHLDNAAGIAGVLKAILSLKNKKLAPSINFKVPNRNIDFINSAVYVNTKLKDWKDNGSLRTCGVSSFGMGGTNCHIVLQEYKDKLSEEKEEKNNKLIFTVSARSEKALQALIEKYKEMIDKDNAISAINLTYTADTGRSHYNYRLAFIIHDIEDLKGKLKSLDGINFNKINNKEIFYGYSKLISFNKEKAKDGEITQSQLDKLNDIANKKVEYMIANELNDTEYLKEICKLYILGAKINWNSLYEKVKNKKKISLPLYPFERKRLWVNIPERLTDAKDIVYDIKLTGRESQEYSSIEKIVSEAFAKVMGLSELDIYSDFYDLGGNSIIATRIINILNEKLNSKIDVSGLLNQPSIYDFCKIIESIKNKGKENSILIQKSEKREYYPLSSAQKRLFVLNELDKLSSNYNIPIILKVEGELNKDKIEDTIKQLIDRHETLRTSFKMIDGEPVQEILDTVDFKINYYEFKENNIDEVISNNIKELIKPFDLSRAPLIRVAIISLANSEQVMLIDIHHIICDGASLSIFERELVKLYNGEKLVPLEIQYKDYVEWSNKEFNEAKYKSTKEYWTSVFSGEIPVLDITTDYPRPEEKSSSGGKLYFKLDENITEKINEAIKETKTTMYMFMLAAYNALLYRHSGQEDIIVGSPIAGRTEVQLENIIGMFANTLALRNYPSGNKKFKEFLFEVKKNVLDAYDNQNFQLEDIIEQIKFKRDPSRNPLFDTMLILQDKDVSDVLELGKNKLSFYKFDDGTSKFDITVELKEVEDGIDICFEYCTDIFKEKTINTLATHFINILKNVSSDINLKISEIDIMSDEEKRFMLFGVNDVNK
ncbi:MAG: amino acid adenylation domain-containing protein [Clostridium sp.]|nr:amino acid adenylation domain-containing protein [Clostridium sp.]